MLCILCLPLYVQVKGRARERVLNLPHISEYHLQVWAWAASPLIEVGFELESLTVALAFLHSFRFCSSLEQGSFPMEARF